MTPLCPARTAHQRNTYRVQGNNLARSTCISGQYTATCFLSCDSFIQMMIGVAHAGVVHVESRWRAWRVTELLPPVTIGKPAQFNLALSHSRLPMHRSIASAGRTYRKPFATELDILPTPRCDEG